MPDLRGRDVFLYIYTSGTTGYPKPAIVRHSRYTMGGIALSGLFGIGADDVIYAPLPLYHGESNFVGFSVAVRAGGGFASRRRFSASEFLDDVRRHHATAFVYVGELCRYLLRQPPTPHDRDHPLRLAVGAGLRPDIWEAFQQRFGIARIVEMYGATEGNVSLMNRSGRVGSVGRAHPFQHHLVRAGALRRRQRRSWCAGPTASWCAAASTSRGSCSAGCRRAPRWRTTATPIRKRPKPSWCATPSGAATPTFAAATSCAATPTATTTSSIASATPSAGRARTSPPRRSPRSSTARPVSARPTSTASPCPAPTGAPGWRPSSLAPGARFDAAAFYAHAEQLPAYARPLFVRLVPAMDVTGTLKQRKSDLQRQGYELNGSTDPVYFRDDAARRYVPLTAALLEQIRSGVLRL